LGYIHGMSKSISSINYMKNLTPYPSGINYPVESVHQSTLGVGIGFVDQMKSIRGNKTRK